MNGQPDRLCGLERMFVLLDLAKHIFHARAFMDGRDDRQFDALEPRIRHAYLELALSVTRHESRSPDGDGPTQVANVSMCEPLPRALGILGEPCKPREAGSNPADSHQLPAAVTTPPAGTHTASLNGVRWGRAVMRQAAQGCSLRSSLSVRPTTANEAAPASVGEGVTRPDYFDQAVAVTTAYAAHVLAFRGVDPNGD